MNIEDVKEDLKKKNYKKALIGIEKILIENPNLEQNVNLKGYHSKDEHQLIYLYLKDQDQRS